MTNDELSARVAEARGEKRERNPTRARQLGGGYFGPEDEFLPWPKPYATDMNAAWELVEEMGAVEINFDVIERAEVVKGICLAYLAFKGVEI